jgi:hypothetical protein
MRVLRDAFEWAYTTRRPPGCQGDAAGCAVWTSAVPCRMVPVDADEVEVSMTTIETALGP